MPSFLVLNCSWYLSLRSHLQGKPAQMIISNTDCLQLSIVCKLETPQVLTKMHLKRDMTSWHSYLQHTQNLWQGSLRDIYRPQKHKYMMCRGIWQHLKVIRRVLEGKKKPLKDQELKDAFKNLPRLNLYHFSHFLKNPLHFRSASAAYTFLTFSFLSWHTKHPCLSVWKHLTHWALYATRVIV